MATLLADNPHADTTTVATQLGISTRTARRHLAALR
ncbi:DeoR family transcriptional regulator [Hamadaea sp. NPDC051192]